VLAALGLPAWLYLTTSDPEERLLLGAVARKALEVRDTLDRNLAVQIVNTYAKAVKRG
jgi:hypothetical protein